MSQINLGTAKLEETQVARDTRVVQSWDYIAVSTIAFHRCSRWVARSGTASPVHSLICTEAQALQGYYYSFIIIISWILLFLHSLCTLNGLGATNMTSLFRRKVVLVFLAQQDWQK